MADFRRCLYALALVALLAGFTASASAQAFQCTNSTGVPPVVRAEGYSELMGDIVLDCTGGIPTPPNQTVPASQYRGEPRHVRIEPDHGGLEPG